MSDALRWPAPTCLAEAGTALWSAIVGGVEPGWNLDARELHFLAQACTIEDNLVALEAVVDEAGYVVPGSRGQDTAHPVLAEMRQLRLAQQKLLGAIEMRDPKTAAATPRQAQASRAAHAMHARRRGVLRGV